MGFFTWSPRGSERYIDSTALKAEMGVFSGTTPAANGVTAVTVPDTNVTANSVITLTLLAAAGTPGGAFVSAKTPGTSFQFKGIAGDTSTYRYEIRN